MNFVRKINRFVWRNIFFILRALIRWTPRFIFNVFYYLFYFIGHTFMMSKRRLVLDNLRIAFGSERPEKELQQIAEKCFSNMGHGMIELLYLLDRPSEILKKVSIEGKENLERVLSEGKGAVIVSAHYGVFILMYLRLVLEGYKVNVIMRKMRDSYFEEYIEEYRRDKGIKTIYSLPERQCVQKSLKALRNGELLIILIDQTFGQEGGIFIDFMGKKASTAPGAVVFAKRAECPIVPVFIMNAGNGKHKIVIEHQIEQVRSEDQMEEIGINLSRASQVVEKYVYEHPHEWGGWMHRRWKKEYEPEKHFYYAGK
jgi:KDO2-lipid IV(A) lauroyltransferase